MYSILVAGAGYAGTRIASFFAAKKQKVHLLTRDPSKLQALVNQGVQAFRADLGKPETLLHLPPAHFIVLAAAPREKTDAAYRQVYIEGIGNFLAALRRSPRPSLVVYLSSSGVWGPYVSGWVDEQTPVAAQAEREKILFQAEEQVLSASLPAVIFRLAGIYGPDRNRIQPFLDGVWPGSDDRNSYMNMIHVDDVIQGLRVIFNKAEEGQVYVGVDDEPVPRHDFALWLAQKLGLSEREREIFKHGVSGNHAPGKRLKNAKLKTLGVTLHYPTFREGYTTILKEKGYK